MISSALHKHYQTSFNVLMGSTFQNETREYQNLRISALEQFLQQGFPTSLEEDWRDSSIESVTAKPYSLSNISQEVPKNLDGFIQHFPETSQYVFRNGTFYEEKAIAEKIHFMPLSRITKLSSTNGFLQPGKAAGLDHNPFVLLNTIFMEDGGHLHIPNYTSLTNPIHLFHNIFPYKDNVMYNQRNIIHVGAHSKATVIEHFLGSGDQPYFNNIVTEIRVEENALLNYIKIQEEGTASTHIASTNIIQYGDSRVSTCHFTVDGHFSRNNIHVQIDGEGTTLSMYGLTLARNHQYTDHHTIIDHCKPNSTSLELFTGIYTNQAHGVFDGRIIVQPDAQKTNAKQSNKNLLLSQTALVNSNPRLEIFADDVKCTHGSTTGQLDENAIFYLQTRGLNPKEAKRLLIRGFTNQMTESLQPLSVKNFLEEKIERWLVETE